MDHGPHYEGPDPWYAAVHVARAGQRARSGRAKRHLSFGLVLYEMLTGKRAFEDSTPASVMGAIMARPAPSIADVAPPVWTVILHRLPGEDPENRWQTARDLHAALGLLGQRFRRPSRPPPSPSRLTRLAWLVAAVATLALSALASSTSAKHRRLSHAMSASRSRRLRNRASTISNCLQTGACSLSPPAAACGFGRSTRSRRLHCRGRRERPACSGLLTANSSPLRARQVE